MAVDRRRGDTGGEFIGQPAAQIEPQDASQREARIVEWAESQGWRPSQTPTGPLKFIDENGVVRVTIKKGSPRTPGSEAPHVELKRCFRAKNRSRRETRDPKKPWQSQTNRLRPEMMEQAEGYPAIPSFEYVYLEDSFVLDIEVGYRHVRFTIDVVLTPDHPEYTAPLPGEQYCYRHARIDFDEVTEIHWVGQAGPPSVDAAGEVDLGSIDVFYLRNRSFALEGDWGQMQITSSPPTLSLV